MERGKRKRDDKDEIDAKQPGTNSADPETDSDGGETATDEQVEEFYAILTRIRVALKYFKNKQNNDRSDRNKFPTGSWKPSFHVHDFESGGSVSGVNKGDDVEMENSLVKEEHPAGFIDLNLEPVTAKPSEEWNAV